MLSSNFPVIHTMSADGICPVSLCGLFWTSLTGVPAFYQHLIRQGGRGFSKKKWEMYCRQQQSLESGFYGAGYQTGDGCWAGWRTGSWRVWNKIYFVPLKHPSVILNICSVDIFNISCYLLCLLFALVQFAFFPGLGLQIEISIPFTCTDDICITGAFS